ncbi:MAG: DUF962 domain-containing protein [Myxococcales bacterium]|nr:MAG: DUF962 domain-containing protein [Myxococcales bacterium]
MKTAEQWFAEYDESHRHPTNKRVHWVCVPAILFSTIALFWCVPIPFVTKFMPEPFQLWANMAIPLVLGALIFYFRISTSIFVGMFFVASLALFASFLLSTLQNPPLWALALGLFVVAWIGQFWGHKVEGKKPSFLKDLQFLFVGPAWVLAVLYRRWNIPI